MYEASTKFDRPPPYWGRLGPMLWAASAAILILAYLALNLPGSWFGGGATLTYPGATIGVAAGSGQVVGDKLIITGADSRNTVVILALITPRIPTQQYGMIALDVEGMPDDADVPSSGATISHPPRCSRAH